MRGLGEVERTMEAEFSRSFAVVEGVTGRVMVAVSQMTVTRRSGALEAERGASAYCGTGRGGSLGCAVATRGEAWGEGRDLSVSVLGEPSMYLRRPRLGEAGGEAGWEKGSSGFGRSGAGDGTGGGLFFADLDSGIDSDFADLESLGVAGSLRLFMSGAWLPIA